MPEHVRISHALKCSIGNVPYTVHIHALPLMVHFIKKSLENKGWNCQMSRVGQGITCMPPNKYKDCLLSFVNPLAQWAPDSSQDHSKRASDIHHKGILFSILSHSFFLISKQVCTDGINTGNDTNAWLCQGLGQKGPWVVSDYNQFIRPNSFSGMNLIYMDRRVDLFFFYIYAYKNV